MEQFGIFAKYWRPGDVKTRLAATIGPQPASELYRCFVATLLRRFDGAGCVRVLAYDPPACRGAFATLAGDRWMLQPQQGGGLGARMHHYFHTAFERGASRAVLIGSDSPDLPTEIVEQAFDLLRHQPVVLGPATDGGYYLIGAADQPPPIFDGVDWSSPSVWDQTVARLQQANLDFAQLPQWSDVDDEADLRRLRDALSADGGSDTELLRAVQRALSHAMRSET